MPTPTAGILLIGNELLSGKVRDENSFYLARKLTAMGIELRRVVLVSDELDEVVEALRDLLGRVDVVFTSGGIGPTHDDITMAAVAAALDRELTQLPDLEERARRIFGGTIGPPHLKMATVPEECELIESDELRWPVVLVDRVYVLAGVPKIFRRGFRAVRGRLTRGRPHHVASIFVTTDEWTLAPLLDATIAAHDDVAVGSYPDMDSASFRVRVTIEAAEPNSVAAAVRDLLSRVPQAEVVKVEE